MSVYKSKNHSKFLLQYHLILVCKYRKPLFKLIPELSVNIKELSSLISIKHNVSIKVMEVDKDHIHYFIETIPNINLANYVKSSKELYYFSYMEIL